MARRLLLTLIATLCALMTARPAGAQTPPDNDGWRTVIYPIHAWVPIFGIDLRLPPDEGGGEGPSVSASGSLSGAALSGFRVERRRFSAEGEFLWAGLAASSDNPHFHADADTVGFRLTAGVRVAPALYIDGGIRRIVIHLNASLEGHPGLQWKPGLLEPEVGFTFRPQLTRNVRVLSRADFGWGGDNSHRTSSATVSVEWKPGWHMAIGGGYGLLYTRADGTIQTQPVHVSQTLHGPVLTLGVVF